jgi:hypothetical protein
VLVVAPGDDIDGVRASGGLMSSNEWLISIGELDGPATGSSRTRSPTGGSTRISVGTLDALRDMRQRRRSGTGDSFAAGGAGGCGGAAAAEGSSCSSCPGMGAVVAVEARLGVGSVDQRRQLRRLAVPSPDGVDGVAGSTGVTDADGEDEPGTSARTLLRTEAVYERLGRVRKRAPSCSDLTAVAGVVGPVLPSAGVSEGRRSSARVLDGDWPMLDAALFGVGSGAG